jgi:polyisoprenoid-binding protein YceI
MTVTEVAGNFERFCGTLYFDDEKPTNTKLELFIDASSINTGLKIRDRDLRNEYLQVSIHPMIHFQSTQVKSADKKRFHVKGDLNLHGKTRQVEFNFLIIADIINDDHGREIGLKISPIAINRLDYDVMKDSMGSGTTGDTITVQSTIRVRELLPYRKDFDIKYPDSPLSDQLLLAKYQSKKGSVIQLISYSGRNFISYDSDDWAWLAELKSVKKNLFKNTSFSNLIEIRGEDVVLINDQTEELYTKAE